MRGSTIVRPHTLHLRQLKIRGLVLVALALLVLTGSLAAKISSTRAVSALTLTKGQSANISVLRFFPDSVRVSLNFKRTSSLKLPELGEWRAKTHAGYIEFSSPGQPILIQVSGPKSTIEYEALPAGSSRSRDLVVSENDGNPNRFAWPSNKGGRPALPQGWSTVKLTVIEVGEPLSGEDVQVVIEPPLSFKSAAPGYGFLWWFFFWPVFALPLAIYAGYLIWQTWKIRRGPRH